MDWGITLAVIGLGVAITSILYARSTYFRQFPKRSLVYGLSVSRLMNLHDDKLIITYDGRVVEQPYIATFTLRSQSRADIPSIMFDAQRSLSFDFTDEIVGVAKEQRSRFRGELAGTKLVFPPQLLRKNDQFKIDLIFDGSPPSLLVANPLIDVAVHELSGRNKLTKGERQLADLKEMNVTMSVGMLLLLASILILSFRSGM
ncbi:hypothetical protein E3T43_00920 [Cryobacterium sp. Hh7]|uniref:hypothetical protein n=1 Tax=Cryobacterium sp. Hh7 TaxID=1259159 RepID=UPI001068EE69|nr:hypothetical protein [Cryobacterium sp. Hh7]TFD61188.1 hypothetical protein E3T43_00920 [Cryobacterium sp. Hh7]